MPIKKINSIPLSEVAELVGATSDANLDGHIEGVKPLEVAGENDISFVSPTTKKRANESYEAAKNTKAAAVFIAEYDENLSVKQLIVKNPLAAVIQMANTLYEPARPCEGIHQTAVISESAKIGENVCIGPYAVISDGAVIGDNSIIHPHVVIYQNAIIGADCIIHAGATIREDVELGRDCLIQSGAVVGGDGFGYVPDKEEGHKRIPHIGNVKLADRVDLGANATVDRATFGTTSVDEATKIDNLVMVGHNNQLGKRNILCSQVGVSGSCKTGDNIVLGGQVGVADHIIIGNNVQASARSGITGNVSENEILGGFPAVNISVWRRQVAALRKIHDILKRLTALEKK